jgi:hypothetical protein
MPKQLVQCYIPYFGAAPSPDPGLPNALCMLLQPLLSLLPCFDNLKGKKYQFCQDFGGDMCKQEIEVCSTISELLYAYHLRTLMYHFWYADGTLTGCKRIIRLPYAYHMRRDHMRTTYAY